MLQLLKFNKKYYQPIIEGRKTQTIRKHNKRLKDNEQVKAIFPGTDKELLIKIISHGYKQFKQLNIDDASLEGYNSVDELKKELLTIYPRLDNFDRLYYYQFRIVEK